MASLTGWSSLRGAARHYYEAGQAPPLRARCGAPITIDKEQLLGFSSTRPAAVKRLRALEVCDHCQAAIRAARGRARRRVVRSR